MKRLIRVRPGHEAFSFLGCLFEFNAMGEERGGEETGSARPVGPTRPAAPARDSGAGAAMVRLETPVGADEDAQLRRAVAPPSPRA